jgi:GDPmannose 4,6-dehydratase
MYKALITGITGQDGTYLAELLLSKGYQVIGTIRNARKYRETRHLEMESEVELVEWDMLSQERITALLSQYRPVEIYNLAAYSSGAGMYDDPISVGDVNGLAVTRILEAIRTVDSSIRFCQASSREIFGEAVESPQSENTALKPRSPYGAAKMYADAMVRIYRQHYNIFACSAILYNHESPLRGVEFVTRKVTRTAARIKLGLETELHIGNLDGERDWGYAGDYVRAMWLMLQQTNADDFVIATGESHSVQQLCQIAFSHLGLDFERYVRLVDTAFRPSEVVRLVGCVEKAKEILGWIPGVNFRELVQMMVDEDMRRESALL